MEINITTQTTSLLLLWTIWEDYSNTTLYNISYTANTSECFLQTYEDILISANVTMISLTELEEATDYTLSIIAAVAGRGSESHVIRATTQTAGEHNRVVYIIMMCIALIHLVSHFKCHHHLRHM